MVLVCPTAKGGVAGGWAFVDLASRNLAPAAMLFDVVNPVMVHGAVAASLPIMDQFELALLDTVQSGDQVHVYPSRREVVVERGHRET